jgi:hypothetical protein
MNDEKFVKDLGGDYFYCYSHRMALFIRAMGIYYEDIGKHPKTDAVYTKFRKTEKLNKILNLWNEIKYIFDDMMDDGTVVIGYGKVSHT